MSVATETLGIAASSLWQVHQTPFRHLRASNVLTDVAYASIASQFREFLEGSRDVNNHYRLKKSRSSYDARMMSVDGNICERFFPFFSRDFIQQLYGMFGIPYIGLVSGALHSSEINSRTGAIHTDFCSAWFDENSLIPGELTFPDHSRVEYFTGTAKVESAKPKSFVRAATLIFYLENDRWRAGHGGETGFYSASRYSANTRFDLVQPRNNSLIAFECSPHSYHRFVTNPGSVRNSIVLWLHTTTEEAESRWGNTIEKRAPQ